MVWIPGHDFTMGTDDPANMANERPAHRVHVAGFWIDADPVTNAQFAVFVAATGYITTAEREPDWNVMRQQLPPGTPKPPDALLVAGSLVFRPTPKPVPLDDLSQWWVWTPGACWRHPEGPGSSIAGRGDHPVVQVSWDDASAYAAWAGKRLPAEAEWECAARGGLENKRYPWGDDFRPGGKYMANTWQGVFPVKDAAADGYAGTSPVGAFPANGYGLHDMAGNVWNWCSDWYDATLYKAASLYPACGRRRAGVYPRSGRSLHAEARDQGRLVPVQSRLLRELPAQRAARHGGRHRHLARRLSLRGVGVVGSQAVAVALRATVKRERASASHRRAERDGYPLSGLRTGPLSRALCGVRPTRRSPACFRAR